MTFKIFEVVDVRTSEGAIHLLSRYGEEVKPLAGGGTELPLMPKDGRIDLRYLINILGIPDIDGIEAKHQGTLKSGTLTRMQSTEDPVTVKQRNATIAEEARLLAKAVWRF